MLSRRARQRDERGAILVLSVVGMVLAMIAAGLAIDLGSIAQDARQNQKVADLGALDGVRVLPNDPTTAVIDSATRNGFECPDVDLSDGCGLTVQWSDSITGIFTSLAATLPVATALRVRVTAQHTNNFPFLGDGRSVSRKATATLGNGKGCYYPSICEQTPGSSETSISPLGTVRVGSTMASATSSDSKILNLLLNRTVGGTYAVDAVGWQGMANANVSLQRLRTALAAEAGTVDGVMTANMKYRRLLDATVDALNADAADPTSSSRTTSATAVTPLIAIRNQVTATAGANVTLDRLLDLVGNFGGGNDVADATINVKDIVMGGMIVANGNNFVSINLTATDIPGLPGTGVTVKFGLIEQPQEKSGPPKTSDGIYRTAAETAQVRLLVESNLIVPIPLLGNLPIKVPYFLEGAGATAGLDALTCPTGADEPSNVKIFANTSVAKASINAVSNGNLTSPSGTVIAAVSTSIGTLTANVDLTSVTVDVKATGAVVSSLPARSGLLTFTGPYDGTTSQKVPGSTALTLPTTMDGNLTVTLSALPTGLTLAGVESAIYAAINPTLTPLNDLIVKPLQRSLGLSLGDADVWAPPVQTCNPTSFNTDPTSSVGPSAPYGYQIPSLVE